MRVSIHGQKAWRLIEQGSLQILTRLRAIPVHDSVSLGSQKQNLDSHTLDISRPACHNLLVPHAVDREAGGSSSNRRDVKLQVGKLSLGGVAGMYLTTLTTR